MSGVESPPFNPWMSVSPYTLMLFAMAEVEFVSVNSENEVVSSAYSLSLTTCREDETDVLGRHIVTWITNR